MKREFLKSKIHRAIVTEANLNYEGSITIDEEIMEAAHLKPFERVHIYNINNGARFDTYVIPGAAGSRSIGLNGAAARLGEIGDRIIIVSYCLLSDEELENYQPTIVLMDEGNRIKETVSL